MISIYIFFFTESICKVLTHPSDISLQCENDSFKEIAGNFNLTLNGEKQVVQQSREKHSQSLFHSFYPLFIFCPKFITSRTRTCGKVMFTVVSVCLSVHQGWGGSPGTGLSPHPETVSNMFNLDLTTQGPRFSWTGSNLFTMKDELSGKRTVGIPLKCLLVYFYT